MAIKLNLFKKNQAMTPTDFQIRPATLNDCAILAMIDAQDNPSAWSPKQFQAACESPQDTVLLMENRAGNVMGLIVWQCVFDEMELHLIATETAHRRLGVASALLASMFQAAQLSAVQRIFLEVRERNVGAQALYLQHGFQIIGRRKQYYQGVEDAILMEKRC